MIPSSTDNEKKHKRQPLKGGRYGTSEKSRVLSRLKNDYNVRVPKGYSPETLLKQLENGEVTTDFIAELHSKEKKAKKAQRKERQQQAAIADLIEKITRHGCPKDVAKVLITLPSSVVDEIHSRASLLSSNFNRKEFYRTATNSYLKKKTPPQLVRTTPISVTVIKDSNSNNKETAPKQIPLLPAQVDQLLSTGTEKALKTILRDNSIVMSDQNRNLIESRLFEIRTGISRSNTIKTIRTDSKVRTGQATFRNNGLRHYQNCVVTGTSIMCVLDAAHIQPANGNNDSLDNCLILRKDLHKLFDEHLWSINPETLTVVLSKQLLFENGYKKLNNKILKLSARKTYLQEHWSNFIAKSVE